MTQATIDTLYRSAVAFHTASAFKEAIDAYECICQQAPQHLKALNGLGTALFQSGQAERAHTVLRSSLTIDWNQAHAHSNLGTVLSALGREEEAVESFREALSINPKFKDALINHGNLCFKLKRLKAAQESFLAALAIDQQSHVLLASVAKSFYEMGQPEETLHYLEKALVIAPDVYEHHHNRGVALMRLGRMAEAVDAVETSLAINPLAADTNFTKSLLLLLHGNLLEGFKQYEWRWQTLPNAIEKRIGIPVWTGEEAICGKNILVYAEQGLGDNIQFTRYFPLLEMLGARIYLEVPKPLAKLAANTFPNVVVLKDGVSIPSLHFVSSTMSLARSFKTTLGTIPFPMGYLKVADDDKMQWRSRLGPKTKFRVGLSWSGARLFRHDAERSLPLENLAQIIALGNIEFHVLQKDIRDSDAAFLAAHPEILVHSEHMTDFASTAALVDEMDLVIAVDTSIAHLAGGLGKPLCIMLPFAPDFRWMLERSDSPWYSSATLYRQSSRGDWRGVVDSIYQRVLSISKA